MSGYDGKTLCDETCRECDKPIRVSRVSPYDGEEEETGCGASFMDEDGREESVGYICQDCAWKRAGMNGEEAFGSIGFDGSDFSFCYYRFPEVPIPRYNPHRRVIEDAIAEGCPGANGPDLWVTPQKQFSQLWDSINAKRDGGIYSWEANPFVWAVEFVRSNL